MSGHSRKYKIMLTNEERNQLKEVLRSSKTCNTIKKRCQILLHWTATRILTPRIATVRITSACR